MTASRQLPLIALPEPAHQPATGTVRLLIFNAQHASPSRARRQAAGSPANRAPRFAKASQAEHAFDRPARPDRHHAVFGRLIAAYKAHVPDRLRRADTAGIGGDLRPPAAVLGLGEDQAVTVRGRSDVQGRAGFRESLGKFTGELVRWLGVISNAVTTSSRPGGSGCCCPCGSSNGCFVVPGRPGLRLRRLIFKA